MTLPATEAWHDNYRRAFDQQSDEIQEWQGVPVPLQDLPLVLHDRHPMREKYRKADEILSGVEMEIVCGGPSYGDEDYVDEVVINSWHSRKRQSLVYVYRQRFANGKPDKYFAVAIPESPDRSMDRLTYWLQTIGASDAWDLDAERKARFCLRQMLSDRQWRHYELTGSFFETSPRSRITYVFRRLRPTIALSPRQMPGSLHDRMRCIALLCMHPIGYYRESWAGCLVPTDDVIAHLSTMRGDEAYYWKKANQHKPSSPEAGL